MICISYHLAPKIGKKSGFSDRLRLVTRTLDFGPITQLTREKLAIII